MAKAIWHMISSGAKKDLLVLRFAQAIFTVSKTDEVFADDNLLKRDSKVDYHLNKRIERAISALETRIKSTSDTLIKRDGYELSKWLRSHLNSKIMPALKSITAKTINLEMLALWILFVNFSERDKSLIPEFEEYAEPNQYFRIIELLGGTAVARLEGELFEEAYRLVSTIKGE